MNLANTNDRATAGYVRLTREESLKSGLSAPAQREEIQKYAGKNSLEPVNFYEEVTATGGDVPFEKRLAGKRLIHDINSGLIGHVIVRDMDRLVRSDSVWPVFRDLCNLRNVAIHTIEGRVDLDSPSGIFTSGLKVLLAQDEKLKGGDRGRRAKRQLAKQGRHTGGPPSFGYSSQSRCLSELRKLGVSEPDARLQAETKYRGRGLLYVDKMEAKIVRLIFKLFVNERLGCRRIATQLNELGYSRRSGKHWHPDKVRRVINDPVVCGFIPYDEHAFEERRARRQAKHNQEFYPGKHEAIITEEIWRRAQEIKSANTSMRKGTSAVANRRYTLSGVMECSCGRRMKAASQQYLEDGSLKFGYYCCYRRRDFGPDAVQGCSAPRVGIAAADSAFWSALSNLLMSNDLVDRVMEAARKIDQSCESSAEDESPEQRLQKLNSDLTAWYVRHDAATTAIEKDLAWARIVELGTQRDNLQKAVKPMKPNPVKKVVSREMIRKFLANFASLIPAAGNHAHRVVQVLVERHGLRVYLTSKDQIRIQLAITPPNAEPTQNIEDSVAVDVTALVPRNEIDSWLADQQNSCSCKLCGELIEVLRRHYWIGLPEYHQKCWASQLTKRRSNPDPTRFYNGMQAAAKLEISRTTLGRLIKSGKITPVYRISNVLLFDKTELELIAGETISYDNATLASIQRPTGD